MNEIPLNFIPVSAKLPPAPVVERAIGYRPSKSKRFIALFWTPSGDEARLNDGRVEVDAYWPGYLALTDHPRIYPEIRDYNLGSSEEIADTWLVLDRKERHLYLAAIPEAKRFLQSRWPQPKAVTPAEYGALAHKIGQQLAKQDLLSTSVPLNHLQITRQLLAQDEAVQEMVEWLNHH